VDLTPIADEPSEEILPGGGLPHWVQVLGAVLVGAVVAALVATQLFGSSTPGAAPTSQTRTPTAAPTDKPDTFGAAEALDVVIDGRTQWLLAGQALARVSASGVVRSIRLGYLHLPVTSLPRLALDRDTQQIWLVIENAAPSRMIQINTRTMQVLRTVTWAQVVYGAVAQDGSLYLANDFGVARLGPGGRRPWVIAGLRGAVGPIALDQARHRIIAVDASIPLAVWSYRPGERPRESRRRLAVGKATLAVADGRIWLGGFGAHGAVLFRLDPRTLLPVAGGAVPTFGPGAVVLAGGTGVIWVRSGGGSDLLGCVDAATARVEQRWHVAGADALASTRGTAVVATSQGALRLVLVGCRG